MMKLLSILALGGLLGGCIEAPPTATRQRHSATLAEGAGAVTPGVAPRQSSPRGMTYEEWAGAMLQWVASLPAAGNPFVDEDGSISQAANSGSVWFLMGPSELVAQPQSGAITMPAGTAIFFSPLAVYGAGPGGIGGDGDDTPEEVAAVADFIASIITDVQVEMDGVPVADTEQYRVVSPIVALDAPEDSLWTVLFGAPGPWTFGAFGGFALFIDPLPPGEHVLHAVSEVPGFGLSFEITYYVTVVPRS